MKKLALVALLTLTTACGSPGTKTAQTAASSPSSTSTSTSPGGSPQPPMQDTEPPVDATTSDTAATNTTGKASTPSTKPKAQATTTTTSGPVGATTSTTAEPTSTTVAPPGGGGVTTTTAKPITTTTRPPTTTTTFGYDGPQFRCNETSKSGWECRGTTLKGDGGYWACWPDAGWQCAGETGNGFGTWSWQRISSTEWQGGGATAMGPRVWDCKWNGSSSFKYWACYQTDQNGVVVDSDNSWMWAPGINTYKVEYKTSSDLACWDNSGWYCTAAKGAFSTHMMMPVPFPLVEFCPGKFGPPPTPGWQGSPCG